MTACRKLFAALVRRGHSERFLRKIKDKTLCELRKNPNKGSSQRCTTRTCKLCSTQVVVVSGKTMGGGGGRTGCRESNSNSYHTKL